MEMDRFKWKEGYITVSELLQAAHPETGVVIFEEFTGGECDETYNTIRQYFLDWDHEVANRENKLDCLTCGLCDEEIVRDDAKCSIDGKYNLTILWVDDLTMVGPNEYDECYYYTPEYRNTGFLECGYCFKTFHRFICSVQMNYVSYLAAKKTKLWSCPLCVPEFRPTISKPSKAVSKVKTQVHPLITIFKCLAACLNLTKNVPPPSSFRRAINIINFIMEQISNNLYEFG